GQNVDEPGAGGISDPLVRQTGRDLPRVDLQPCPGRGARGAGSHDEETGDGCRNRSPDRPLCPHRLSPFRTMPSSLVGGRYRQEGATSLMAVREGNAVGDKELGTGSLPGTLIGLESRKSGAIGPGSVVRVPRFGDPQVEARAGPGLHRGRPLVTPRREAR